MTKWTIAALCVGLAAAPLAADAADLILFNGAGQPVAVLVPEASSVDWPGVPADLFARQDAMLDHMTSMMDAAFSSGQGTLSAEFGTVQPGSMVMRTSFSDGNATCSRTVIYEQRGAGAPIVHVSQTGDSCAALGTARPGASLPAALPAPSPDTVAPRSVPGGTRLIRVDYRHPAARPTLHRG